MCYLENTTPITALVVTARYSFTGLLFRPEGCVCQHPNPLSSLWDVVPCCVKVSDLDKCLTASLPLLSLRRRARRVQGNNPPGGLFGRPTGSHILLCQGL